jgi:hypothetical protein
VRITGNVLTALTSQQATRRYNYCPGCGTALDTELLSASEPRQEQAAPAKGVAGADHSIK